MIKQATKEQIEFVNKRMESGFKKTREEFPGDYWKAFYGFLGQIVIGDILGCKREIDKMDEFDIIWQGKKWDVKTEIRSVKFLKTKYRHNLNERQIDHDCEGYIFISYNQTNGDFEICGHIGKERFREKARLYKPGDKIPRTDGTLLEIKGKYGMFEIENKYLEEFK